MPTAYSGRGLVITLVNKNTVIVLCLVVTGIEFIFNLDGRLSLIRFSGCDIYIINCPGDTCVSCLNRRFCRVPQEPVRCGKDGRGGGRSPCPLNAGVDERVY